MTDRAVGQAWLVGLGDWERLGSGARCSVHSCILYCEQRGTSMGTKSQIQRQVNHITQSDCKAGKAHEIVLPVEMQAIALST
jgi:hypothetical protein